MNGNNTRTSRPATTHGTTRLGRLQRAACQRRSPNKEVGLYEPGEIGWHSPNNQLVLHIEQEAAATCMYI